LILGVALFALVGWFLGDGKNLAVEILIIFTASVRVLPAFLRFQASWMQVSRALPFTTEIVNLMKLDNHDHNTLRDDVLINDKKIAVSIRNLSFTYPNTDAQSIKNLNFDIEENSIFILKGESGAGKTTLINLIMGFLTPDEGNIFFQPSGSSTVKRIALVSQESKFMNASILENVALGEDPVEIAVSKVVKALDEANILNEVLALPEGIYESLGENSMKFSGGQRQRLTIARALYAESKILIFDEPTSALDEDSTTSFIDLLKRLAQNRTIVVVTHDSRIAKCANSVLKI
jgi:ATP-binding cassette, subfamily B, bacterial PglK